MSTTDPIKTPEAVDSHEGEGQSTDDRASQVLELSYLGVEARDVGEWADFARDVLGMSASPPDPDGSVFLRMDRNHHRVAVHEGAADDLAYVGWRVADRAALDDVSASLKSAGFEVSWGLESEAEDRGVSELIRVVDPSGVRHEVHWGFTSDPAEFEPSRDISGFKTDELGLGHFVLNVEDYQASLDFFLDGLGLSVTDYCEIDMGADAVATAAFLHCGPRHHSVALVAVPSAKRMHHMMVEVLSMDDVGATLDLCQEREIPIVSSLGRHTNDLMYSFYMQSPSGFQIEYGFGGLVIDDAWQPKVHKSTSIWGHRYDPEAAMS